MNTFLYIGDFRNAHVEVLGLTVLPECLECTHHDLIIDGSNIFRFWRPRRASLLDTVASLEDPNTDIFKDNLDGMAVIIDEVGSPPRILRLAHHLRANDNKQEQDDGFPQTISLLEFGCG